MRGPFPARSHANAVIGLAASVEIDANETGSPTNGAAGNHANEAAGGGGADTVSVAGVLVAVPAAFLNTARY
jgi:hypothetical protein